MPTAVTSRPIVERKRPHLAFKEMCQIEHLAKLRQIAAKIVIRHLVDQLLEAQRIQHRQLFGAADRLAATDHGDLAKKVRLPAPGCEAQHARLACGGDQDAAQHLERRGFSRAVWPDKTDHLARPQFKRNPLNGSDFTVLAPEERGHSCAQAALAHRRSVGHRQVLNSNNRHIRFLSQRGWPF